MPEAWKRGEIGEIPQILDTVRVIVKNTFIETVDDSSPRMGALARSASDSDLSASSGEELRFWSHSATSAGTASNPDNPAASTAPLFPSRPPSVRDDVSAGAARNEWSFWPEGAEPPLPEIPVELPLGSSCAAHACKPQCSASTDDQDIPPLVQQLHEETGTPINELMEAAAEHDLSLVPRHRTSGVLLSIGSASHDDGGCNPCIFHARKMCLKGVLCLFCHVRHRGTRLKRYRPPKKKRDKMASAANRAEPLTDAESSGEDEEDVQGVSSSLAAAQGSALNQSAWQRSHFTVNDAPRATLRL